MIYGHGDHVGYVTELICINLIPIFPKVDMKFGLKEPISF